MIHEMGRFWRRDADGWIKADSNDNSSGDANTVFLIARLDDNKIALISRGNNRFCQRGANNRFRADIDSGVKEVGLIVEKPIIDR